MKKLIAILAISLTGFVPVEDKKLSVEMSLDKWQTVLNAMATSDGISAKKQLELSNEIVTQLNKQLDTLSSPKK